jgi:hypothetical protein
VRAVSRLGKAIKRRGRFEAPVPFGTLIEGVRFAVDSPLEGAGFEPSVPLEVLTVGMGVVKPTFPDPEKIFPDEPI